MTPTASTPAATPAPAMDLSSAIDALPTVMPEAETPGADTPPALDTPSETPEVTEEATPETDPADGEQQAQTEAEPEELDPADELAPDKISPDGKQYHFRAAKAKALLAARDFHQQVQQAVPNATPDQLRANYDRATQFDTLLDDFHSGDPARIGGVAQAFVADAGNPQAAAVFADSIMANIANTNPQAFGAISKKIINSEISNLYREAQRSGDDAMLKLAQNLDFKQTGKFRTAEQLAQRDPMAEDRARFEQERSQFYSERQRENHQRIEQQVQDATGAAESSVTEEITKSLPASITDAIKAAPGGEIHLRHINRDLQDAVAEARKANPTWQRNFDLAVSRFRANPSAEAKNQLVTMMRQFASPIIARNRNAVVKAVTGRILSDNAAAHAKQQQIATRTEPNSASAPVRRPALTQQLKEHKDKGGSLGSAIDAVFSSVG